MRRPRATRRTRRAYSTGTNMRRANPPSPQCPPRRGGHCCFSHVQTVIWVPFRNTVIGRASFHPLKIFSKTPSRPLRKMGPLFKIHGMP
jgi:hypothetical protein